MLNRICTWFCLSLILLLLLIFFRVASLAAHDTTVPDTQYLTRPIEACIHTNLYHFQLPSISPKLSHEHYTSWNMQKVRLYPTDYVLCVYHSLLSGLYDATTISFRVASQALGQSYDCPSASEVTMKDMGKINQYLSPTKHNKTWTVLIIIGIYCTRN